MAAALGLAGTLTSCEGDLAQPPLVLPEGGYAPAGIEFPQGERQFSQFTDPEFTEGFYLLVSGGRASEPVKESYSYDYIQTTPVTIADGSFEADGLRSFYFARSAKEDCWFILDRYGRYVFMDESHASFQVNTGRPAYGALWQVTPAEGGRYDIRNVDRQVSIVWASNYNNFSSGADKANFPLLYRCTAE